MACGPIISWQIDEETMETVRDFIFGAPKSLQTMTTAMKLKGRCSLEEMLIKKNSILKSRDITLLTKTHRVFLVVMYGCETWTIKKAEHQRIDAFELWCWRRLSRVPWAARRSNQSVLEEISPEYSLEGLMLKWKLQYFGHLIRRTDSLEKTLMLGKTEGRRRRGRQRMRWLDGITDTMDISLGSWWWTGRPVCCSPWGPKELDTTELLKWTELNLQFKN